METECSGEYRKTSIIGPVAGALPVHRAEQGYLPVLTGEYADANPGLTRRGSLVRTQHRPLEKSTFLQDKRKSEKKAEIYLWLPYTSCTLIDSSDSSS